MNCLIAYKILDSVLLFVLYAVLHQSLLDIVSSYVSKWRYQINSCKSGIMVFGESSRLRPYAKLTRSWSLSSEQVNEVDKYCHLGVLCYVSNSIRDRVTERWIAGHCAFFALNAVRSRIGSLHPITSYRLYSSLSLPIMLYGSELWKVSKSDILMLNRVHKKIL